jgi:hypothetical protein
MKIGRVVKTVAHGRGRAKLRLSRAFPVGFATTHEPNGTAAIWPHQAWYEPEAAVQLGLTRFWAKRP